MCKPGSNLSYVSDWSIRSRITWQILPQKSFSILHAHRHNPLGTIMTLHSPLPRFYSLLITLINFQIDNEHAMKREK